VQPKRHDPLPFSPPKPRTTPAFNVWARRPSDGETIEDASQEEQYEEDDAMLPETAEYAERREDWPPSSKRQRRSLDGIAQEHSEYSFAHPTLDITPALSSQPASYATPRRFMFSQSMASSSIAPATPFVDEPHLQSLRPAFLKPPSAPLDTSEPLPEAFSPHRRGQKFVPGGMAAEVRQWIVDATQTTGHSHARRSGGDVMRVRVMESRGSTKDGVILVRGSVEGKEVRLILPSAGKSRNTAVLGTGDLLGIKPPSWEVGLDRDTWVVAADWRVLRD
jgi:hypothetical protein